MNSKRFLDSARNDNWVQRYAARRNRADSRDYVYRNIIRRATCFVMQGEVDIAIYGTRRKNRALSSSECKKPCDNTISGWRSRRLTVKIVDSLCGGFSTADN